MTLVFCTQNDHKKREVTQIMGPGFRFLTLHDISFNDDIPEPFDSLEENSLIKAKTIFDRFGENAFAEDSGLFVESLQGAPGVKSARFAGEQSTSADNIRLLMEKLGNSTQREAYFKTVVTLIVAGEVKQFSGICRGHIALSPSGTDGFGYDPVFIPEGSNRTFAEYSAEEKNAISHRKKAFAAFADYLKSLNPA